MNHFGGKAVHLLIRNVSKDKGVNFLRSSIKANNFHSCQKYKQKSAVKVEDDYCEKSRENDEHQPKAKAEDYDVDDDAKYFKGLSKSTNSYWLRDVDSVFERIDWNRLTDPGNRPNLIESFRRRCVDANLLENIDRALKERSKCGENLKRKKELTEELVSLALWAPNDTHPNAIDVSDEVPQEVFRFGNARESNEVMEFSKFCNKHGLLRDDQLGNLAYQKSYYLKGPLAELEEGLVRYSLNSLVNNDFQLMSVPDIIYPHIIESCGMRTRSERDQVFWLQSESGDIKDDVCLSGTAEMSIGGSLQNLIFNEEDLPLKLTSVSRCFRAETSSLEEERGLFRVHEFTKVEMFGVTANESGKESNELHQQFRQIEEENFANLNIHFKTLEMPPSELGTSAYRKFDIEAWMPGRKMYGEISSCSNCTDFQSRRFNIRYRPKNGEDLKFVHTVNGTACAVPRLMITLVETFQNPNGSVDLPKVLIPFMPRDWNEAIKNFKKYNIRFLRTKSQQDKYIHNTYPNPFKF